MDDDSNYTSKQITKKHFTSELPLQKIYIIKHVPNPTNLGHK